MVKLTGDTSDFVGKMNGASGAIVALGDKMQAVGQRMQSIGQQWSLYISAPLIAMGKAALDSAADFEQSMNVMQQVTGATTGQMDALSKQALQLGKDTVFGAGEAADAQLTLAKAGFEVQEILDAATGVINMAAAADMDLAEAADVSASAVRAFNLEAADTTHISDLLAAAANNSTAGVHDMALALKQSSAVMAQYGFTVEETVTMLAQLANAGIKNSDAGTSLKVAFMRLAAPTEKAAETMSQYGIEVYDAEGKMKSASEIIQMFAEKLGAGAQITRTVGGVTEDLGKEYDKVKSKIDPLVTKIQEQNQELGILQQELTATTEKYGEGSIQAQKKALAISKLSAKIEENTAKLAEYNDVTTAYTAATTSATSVTAALTEQERNAALETIFGTDAIRTMNVLMAQGIDKHLQMAEAVTEQGAAQEIANARMKGLAGAIEYFKGTLDSLMIETALPWLDQLSAIIRGTADWIAKFGELDPAVQKTIVIVAALAAALGPLLIYSGLLVQATGALISAFGVMLVPLGLMAAGFTALSLALGINIQDWIDLGMYLWEVINTGNYLNEWLHELPGPLRTVAEYVGMVISSLKELGLYLWEVITTGNEYNQWLLQLPAPLQKVALAIGTFISAIQDLTKYLWEVITTGDHLNKWLEELPEPIRPVVEAIGKVISVVRDVGAGFAEEFPAMITEVRDLASTVGREIPLIVGHFADLWNSLSGGANGRAVGQFLGKFVTTAIKGVGTILTQIRAVMDAFDILVRATGAILAGDWAGYWALKDEWNKAWATFGAATADQWKQFSSMFDAAEVPQPTGPYLGTQGFASGGWVGRSGRYLVGEEGAEMVDLPAGAYVHNARDTERMGGITINLPLTVPAGANAHQVTLAARDGILQGLRQVGLA